jgi:glutathione S-transferase
MGETMHLIIGNKSYSSWSLRPWVLLKHFNIDFKETLIRLDQPNTPSEIKKYSPSGKVPALIDDGQLIWDSLAIMEYLNEKFPEKQMYPADAKRRAKARSITCEMHSGFLKMRTHMTFKAKARFSNFDYLEAKEDVDRVESIWTECLTEFAGPFLFGNFSIADAMYAPVVGRFITYDIPVNNTVKEYCSTIMNLPAMKLWYQGAQQETFIAANHE